MPPVAADHHFTDLGVDLDAPLYTEREARAALASFVRSTTEPRLRSRRQSTRPSLDAGHILGSAIIVVRVEAADGGRDTTIVFSGDLGRPGSPILRDYTSVPLPTTCWSRPPMADVSTSPRMRRAVLAETIRLVAESDGVLLIPAFAIGRTQELIYQLDRLIDEGAIPQLPLYLDSPMGSKATDIYRRHLEDYDDKAAEIQRSGERRSITRTRSSRTTFATRSRSLALSART